MLLPLVPRPDRQHAHLQLERRRHPVERLHPVRRDALAVGVEIDEAGAHHLPARIDQARALGLGDASDPRDAAVPQADIGNLVAAGLGIDHPSPGNDAIESCARHDVPPPPVFKCPPRPGRFRKGRSGSGKPVYFAFPATSGQSLSLKGR